MDHEISPEEAAAALSQIEASKAAFRSAIGASRGYQHLWLWGGIWIAQCLTLQLGGRAYSATCNLFAVAGVLGSFLLGITMRRHLRTRCDRRFLGVIAALIGGGVIAMTLLPRNGLTLQTAWAYTALLAMQCYVVAGIWFDSFLLVIGLVTGAFILAGYWWFTPIFWWWMAVFGGGSLVAGGFYIKLRWK